MNVKIKNTTENFNKIIIDLGTGNGRFVYKSAKENPENMYIGIDPAIKQTKDFQRKINREKLNNAIFYSAPVEDLPQDLNSKADKVFINFPWGSLLGGIANGDSKIIGNVVELLKESGEIEIILGYNEDAEPSETKRLELKDLDEKKIETTVIPAFEKFEMKLKELTILTRDEIFELQTSWAKKLSFGQDRKIFKLIFVK